MLGKMDISQAIINGIQTLFIPEPLRCSEWMDKNFYLSPESSSIQGPWKSLPYQIGPLNWIGNDNIHTIDIQKSARVGYTKWIIGGCGYFIEHKKRNVLTYQPTDSDAQDFVKDEVNAMLRDVPVVRKCLKCDPETKSEYNTMEKKCFYGATWDIKGGKSPRNYRRMTKDVVCYDELDAFDQDIGGGEDGEGGPTDLGDVRISTSSFPKSIRGTTPKIKNTSLIEASIAQATMLMWRYLPCPHCDGMQRLEWKNFKWENDDPTTVQYHCRHCGAGITYDQYPEMDAAGRWQTDDWYWYDEETDCFFDPDNQLVEDPYHLGVRIWAAYSYFLTWPRLVNEFIIANRDAKIGKLTKLKTFVNTYLGETWEEIGERVVQKWADRVEEYEPDALPAGVLYITAGCDVQGGKDARIEAEIVGWGIGEESWSIDYLSIPGDPEQQEVWDHLDEELMGRFIREDGVALYVSAACVDAGYLPSRVHRFTRPRKRRRIFATKGKSQHTGPLSGKPSWQGEKGLKALQYPVNTDEAKTILFTRIERVKEKGPGYCHFPSRYVNDYFDMLTAEEKVLKKINGSKRYVWEKKTEHTPNEAIDCRVNAMVALQIGNPNLPKLKLRLEQEADAMKNKVAPARVGGRAVRSKGLG
jgi:phage terminase large subunit GpA-like protein